MNKIFKTILYTITMSLFFIGCESDDAVSSTATTVDVPTTYNFESRFNAGESSVSYSGQVVRNIIIGDIKSSVGTASAATLNSLFNNDNATATISGTSTTYHSISTKKLSNKISETPVIGFDVTPTALITGWFDLVGGATPTKVVQNMHMDQLIGKGLLGMVAYYQGTSVYMDKIDTDTNTQDGTSAYSDMEHHWDESFGYFGAARDYGTMTDKTSSGGSDYLTQKNFDWAKYAAKRDACTDCPSAGNFATNIFNAYLKGRALITAEATLSEIQAERQTIVENWEKVIAANIVHYANEVDALISAGGTDFDCSTDNSCQKYWSEMAAFVLCLQFNSYSDLVTADHEYLWTNTSHPPAANEGGTYQTTNLTNLKTKLGTLFSFEANDLANW